MTRSKLWEMFVIATSLSQQDSDRPNTDIFLNELIQFYANNATDLHHLTSHSTSCCPTTQRGDRTLTTDYCDVTSRPYVYRTALCVCVAYASCGNKTTPRFCQRVYARSRLYSVAGQSNHDEATVTDLSNLRWIAKQYLCRFNTGRSGATRNTGHRGHATGV